MTAGTLIFLRETSDHGVEVLTSSPTSVKLDFGLAILVSPTLLPLSWSPQKVLGYCCTVCPLSVTNVRKNENKKKKQV